MKKLYKISCIAFLYFVSSISINAQPYGSFIHNVSEDSYVRGNANANINYVSEVELLVKGTPSNLSNYRKTVLKFDLSTTSYNLNGSDKAVLLLLANNAPSSTTINAYE